MNCPNNPIPTQRRCGAAALRMVLQSLGVRKDLELIWESCKTPTDSTCRDYRIETYRLAGYAGVLGFSATVGRVRDPGEFLRSCCVFHEVRFILNHRTRPDSHFGHFSVLAGLNRENDTISINDPTDQSERQFSLAEFCRLWTPLGPQSEITGFVGVIVSRNHRLFEPVACSRCNAVSSVYQPGLWKTVFCPQCGKPIPFIL